MYISVSEPFNYHIILASSSPRRHDLLRALSIPFEIRIKKIHEIYPHTIAVERVPEYLARLKAKAYQAELLEKELVITADTVVILDEQILEKPKDKAQAIGMLKRLSGKTHRVITGVCLLSTTFHEVFSETTSVTFEHLEASEILNYIRQHQPYDKAGGYGVQEWLGMIAIKHIAGSYYNVMGLPVHRLYRVLKQRNASFSETLNN